MVNCHSQFEVYRASRDNHVNVIVPKDADGNANRVDPDQTALLGAV